MAKEKDFSGLNLPFTVSDQEWQSPIETDIEINTADLDYEFQTHPEKYAWWAFLAEHARAEVEFLKSQLSHLYARLDFESRDKARREEASAAAAKRKPIRYTEKMYDAEVITHPEYQELVQKINIAKRNAGLAAAGRASMDHRRDMLLQIGANYRTEGQADPVILKEAARDKARERAQRKEQEKQSAQSSKTPPPRKRPTVS